MPIDLSRETTIALRAAQEAGAVALGMQGGIVKRDKADGSPVTDGDLAADAVLRSHLALHFPGDAILSEECPDDQARLTAERLWIIDPIDGTKDYVAGLPGWAVQIGLAIGGRIVLGVLAIPREGVCLVGVPGSGGTLLQGERAQELRAVPGKRDVLVGSDSARNREAMAKVRGALPEFGSMRATSVGVKVWRMLAGEADLYVHPRSISEWDVAAPAAVLLAAGGRASDLAGRDFRFNVPEASVGGLVFSTRPDHDAIVARLGAAGVRA